ncbi:MAG: orotidine 5'-phosphate decarboxylase / HUMPS family protein [bacterium]|nr:orotidine 5'-phosphate decarboxylase / HUMPS family protein [bacterium]
MDSKGKLWVALDADKAKSLEIIRKIGPARLSVVRGVKLNRSLDQEVFRLDGEPRLFQEIADAGLAAWADIKAHDVSRTVAGRVEPYAQSGLVQYLTVMAKGEIDMMMAAVKAGGDKVKIIAVTELTSLSEEEIHLGSGHPAKASVINLARLAVLAGVQYLVCSGQELPVIRKRPELKALKPFVPGVNPSFASAGSDQARTMTIVDALKQGADAVVVGGAIVNAPDPVDVIKRIAQEIEEAKS